MARPQLHILNCDLDITRGEVRPDLIGAVTEGTRVTAAVVDRAEGPGLVHVESRPDRFVAGGREYSISILQILADQGMVVVSIPGLTGVGSEETLVLEVSKKPLIALVWLGAVLILIGSLFSMVRRHGELPRAA